MTRLCRVCGKPYDFGSKTKSYTCDDCLTAGLKYCNTCHRVKALVEFKPRGTTVCGNTAYESSCNDCLREYKRTYQKKYGKTTRGNAKLKTKNIKYHRHCNVGDLTATQWQSILELFEFKCAYCGSTEKLSMEHLLPVSKGGTLTKGNIIVACQHCNSSRGNKDLDTWLQTIDEEHKAKIIWYMNEGHKSIE